MEWHSITLSFLLVKITSSFIVSTFLSPCLPPSIIINQANFGLYKSETELMTNKQTSVTSNREAVAQRQRTITICLSSYLTRSIIFVRQNHPYPENETSLNYKIEKRLAILVEKCGIEIGCAVCAPLICIVIIVQITCNGSCEDLHLVIILHIAYVWPKKNYGPID